MAQRVGMKPRPSVLFFSTRYSEGGIERRELDPREIGIARCEARELAGGDAAVNLAALERVFEGKDRGAHLAALLLQAGMALTIAGRASSIEAGIAMAREVVASGAAHDWLRGLRQFAARRAGAAS